MEQVLNQFGLTPEEIVVYKALLKLGGAKVSKIAEVTGFKRTSTQEYVRSLSEKGFINSTRLGNKYLYQTEDPDTFRQIINERQYLVDRLVSQLRTHESSTPWQARSLFKEEVIIDLKRYQKKKLPIKSFGSTVAGGAFIKEKKIVLWSNDAEIPSIEIIASEILSLHLALLR